MNKCGHLTFIVGIAIDLKFLRNLSVIYGINCEKGTGVTIAFTRSSSTKPVLQAKPPCTGYSFLASGGNTTSLDIIYTYVFLININS